MAEAATTTRERLLEAARDLFTSRGYHATTTPVLAKHAGVAEGTIYRHFASKHVLLNAAYQDVQAWGVAATREVNEGPGQTSARLGRLGLRWLTAAETDPARMRMLLSWRLEGELDAASRLAAQGCRQGIQQMIAVGKQEGTVRAGAVELWASVWLALVSSAVERVASREWTAGHPHALATVEAAWEAIAARPISPPVVGVASSEKTGD